jgi:hypothetical protein
MPSFCPRVPQLDHALLAPGDTCQGCQAAIGSSTAMAISNTMTSKSTQNGQRAHNEQLVADLRASAINYNSIATRNNVTATAPTPNPTNAIPLNTIVRFSILICHAVYTDASLSGATYNCFSEGWTIGLNRNAVFSYDELKNVFRSSFQAKYIPFFDKMVQRKHGHWLLSQNHKDKDSKKPFRPLLFVEWPDEWTISDIIDLQPFYTAAMKRIAIFPTSLIHYPHEYNENDEAEEHERLYRREASAEYAWADDSVLLENANRRKPWDISETDNLIPAVEDKESLPEDIYSVLLGTSQVLPALTKTATHKRSISQAVPQHERPNAKDEEHNNETVLKSKRKEKVKTRSGREVKPKK